MDPAVLVQYLKHQRLVVDHVYMSAAAIMIYDYFLMLPLEVKFIWFSRWRYTEMIFLLIRYLPFVTMGFAIYNQVALDLSSKTCQVTSPLVMWLMMSKIVIAESILAIRTWAVWCRNKAVGIGLVALMLVNLVVQCVTINEFNRSMEHLSPPYSGFRGCFVITYNRILIANYGTLTVVQAIVLGLMAISAFRLYRRGSNSELSHVIHRDAILFYVYLFVSTAANLVILIAAPPVLMALLFPMEGVMYSVLTARIILNIRQANEQGLQTKLHTSFHDLNVFDTTSQLVFDEISKDHTVREVYRDI